MTTPARTIDEIWSAIEAGDGERAVRLARKLDDSSDPAAVFAIAVAHLEGGEPEQAARGLRTLESAPLGLDDEFRRRYYLAQAEYELGEAESSLELLSDLATDAADVEGDILWWQGLCHDHLGDGSRADECFEAAASRSPVLSRPTPITPESMEKIVESVIARMPEKLQAVFEELPVIIQDLPSRELVRSTHGSVHPDTLGLYTGANLAEQSVLYSCGLPSAIFLYRRNLERFVTTKARLEQEIETTLLHELGHHLGFEEQDLEERGLA